eukprot:12335821-Alexandrium_andersonii.AAC.1
MHSAVDVAVEASLVASPRTHPRWCASRQHTGHNDVLYSHCISALGEGKACVPACLPACVRACVRVC